MRELAIVAHHSSHNHASYIYREGHTSERKQIAHYGTYARSHNNLEHSGSICRIMMLGMTLLNDRFSLILRCGQEMELLDETSAYRTANERTCHQSEGSSSRRKRCSPTDSHFFKQRTKCTSRTMSSHHRNRARGHANQASKAKATGNTYRHNVLNDNDQCHKKDKQQQRSASLPDSLEIGLKTDRCEEKDHTHLLHRIIEAAHYPSRHIANERNECKEQASNHRRRDAELRQQPDSAFQDIADPQSHHCHCQGLIYVKRESHDIEQYLRCRNINILDQIVIYRIN